MIKKFSNKTKAKILFVFLSIVLVLATWYKLKIHGITMVAEAEVEYKTVLTCENTDPEHVHTDECYDLVEVEIPIEEKEDNLEILEEDSEDKSEVVSQTIEDSTMDEVIDSFEDTELSEINNNGIKIENENALNSEEVVQEDIINDDIIVESDVIEQVSPQEITYEDSQLKVIASAIDDNAIPYGTTIIVTPIVEGNAKYTEVEGTLISKVEENNQSLAGFLAYDITLKDANGNDIEPNGKVNISLNYKNALIPIEEFESEESLEISVQHFEENNDGEVIAVVDLSDNNQLQVLDATELLEVKKIQFETESFSTFTITWSRNNVTRAKINIHYVDEAGNELNGKQSTDITYKERYSTSYNFSNYADLEIDGKKYKEAHLNSINGEVVTTVIFSVNNTFSSYYYTKFINGDIEVSSTSSNKTYDVYLVYGEEQSQGNKEIVFLHQKQDTNDFTNQNNYRPYDGFGSKEATNYVKFIVLLADKDGNFQKKVINSQTYPIVELPDNSIVPDRYVLETDSNGVLKIDENTFYGISIPGYSYAGSFAYFGWTSNNDMNEGNMANVSEFKNFGKMSSKYNNTYYSTIGFKTSRGNPGYSDYYQSDFGNSGNGYYAYNPTGVLMLVLKPVDENISYKTRFHNDYNPDGIPKTNIVDTTLANMIKDDWNAVQYQYNFHGEAIMTTKTENDLIAPSEGYEFDGWYDNVDSEGNGTGNKVGGWNNQGYFYAIYEDQEENQVIKMYADNDLYARWVPKKGKFSITKTITGGLNVDEINHLKSRLEFDILNENQEVIKTISALEDMIWNENVGTYTLDQISILDSYTVIEKNANVLGHELNSKITYPDNENYIIPVINDVNEIANVYIENEYTTNLTINKIDKLGNFIKGGAVFNIYLKNDDSVSKTIADMVSSTEYTADGNEDGKITFSNIKYSTNNENPEYVYVLTEIEAPIGYYKFETPIEFYVRYDSEADKDVVTIINKEAVSEYVSLTAANTEISVINMPCVTMPKAGGQGTTLNYILGISIILGSFIVLSYKKYINN